MKSLNIKSHFPENYTPRIPQESIVSQVADALQSDTKFIIIQAPTGSGKSHIAATIANAASLPPQRFCDLVNTHEIYKKDYVSDTYIYEKEVLKMPPFGCVALTVTKALQDQYTEIFDNCTALKGKQNYVCEVDGDFDCDLAPCLLSSNLLNDCWNTKKCHFHNARDAALQSKFGALNYSVFLNMPDFLKRKQIIVCDEASELEDELVKHYSCEVNYKTINVDEMGISKLTTTDPFIAHRWLSDLLVKVKLKVDAYVAILKTSKKASKRKLLGDVTRARIYKNLYDKIRLILCNWSTAEFIITIDGTSTKFVPLYVDTLAQNFYKHNDHIILMSGTIINHKLFAETLGIKDYKYIEVDSEFAADKSPIYSMSKVKLTYKNVDVEMPKLMHTVKELCDHYKDQKGIIHTHTNKITKIVQAKFGKDKRFIFREPGVTNEVVLREHFLRDDASIIVSPSLGFGTDLCDEFGRFSIVLKTPYLPLGDERIKKLAKKNQGWYEMKAMINLVQMCGRTTRSKDDFSDTYILDGTAVQLIKKNVKHLPIWFRNRLA